MCYWEPLDVNFLPKGRLEEEISMSGTEDAETLDRDGGERSGRKRKASNPSATEDKNSKSNLKKTTLRSTKKNSIDQTQWTAEKGYSNFVEGSVSISQSNTDQRQVNHSQSTTNNEWPSLGKSDSSTPLKCIDSTVNDINGSVTDMVTQ